jgi:hypothetical protein
LAPFADPSPSPTYTVPTAPAWGGDPITYGEALDSWLADLRQLSDDPAWLEWYRRMHGEPTVETPLPPYPARGDTEGWRRWWAEYNRTFAEAGASADGLDYDTPPVPDPTRARRRRRFRRRVEAIVHREIDRAIPTIIAAAVEVLRG